MLQKISFLRSINTEHCFIALSTGLWHFLLDQLIRRKGTEERKHNACAFFTTRNALNKKPGTRCLCNLVGI